MSRVQGITKLRKTLNRIEPSAKRHVTRAVEQAGIRVRADAVSIALAKDIYLTGEMIDSITYKMSRDKLTVVIGPGADRSYIVKNPFSNTALGKKFTPTGKLTSKYIKNAEARWNFMKGFWAEFGTGPPIPQRPMPFMEPAYRMNRPAIRKMFDRAVTRALTEAAR